MNECDAVIFLADGKSGITGSDEEIADFIRRGNKPVIVAVNKLDDPKHDDLANDAYILGFENVIPISALHKRGIYELLDAVMKYLPADDINDGDDGIRIVIAGKPNVSKSSMLNRITSTERSLMSPIAGTTRDPVDTVTEYDGVKLRIIDTAGLRRRAKFDGDLEYYSFVRTLAAVDRSDVALLMMDAEEPCTDQDKRIASHVVRKGKGIIIAVNKWDMINGEKKADEITRKIRDEMPFLSYAPVIFTSALNGRNVAKILTSAITVSQNRKKHIIKQAHEGYISV